jgi:transcriptional regulator with XRE-family HTH domain
MDHIRSTSTTDEVLREIGARLRTHRLQQNLSLDELAEAAGVGRATVARAEAGHNASLETLVKLLRALGRLTALDAFLPAPIVSPLQLAALQGQQRQRARRPRKRSTESGGTGRGGEAPRSGTERESPGERQANG